MMRAQNIILPTRSPSQFGLVNMTLEEDNFVLGMSCVIHTFKTYCQPNREPPRLTYTYLAHRFGTAVVKPVIVNILNSASGEVEASVDGRPIRISGNIREMITRNATMVDGRCTFKYNQHEVQVVVTPAVFVPV